MNFMQFAQANGLIVDHIIHDRWVRVPTIDKPYKKNGAYKFDGYSGAVRNFAVHEKAVIWRSNSEWIPDAVFRQKAEKARQDRIESAKRAVARGAKILNEAEKAVHPYLDKKGFADQKVFVWNEMVILPMRKNGKLVGCQMIDKQGNKKFLSGQITKGASLTIDNKGRNILVEGFATGLSVRQICKELRMRYTIHVCFSAGNMTEVAKQLKDCLVIADNDPVGIRVAKGIGDYWVSDIDGEDFNDAHLRLGTKALAESFSAFIRHKSHPPAHSR